MADLSIKEVAAIRASVNELVASLQKQGQSEEVCVATHIAAMNGLTFLEMMRKDNVDPRVVEEVICRTAAMTIVNLLAMSVPANASEDALSARVQGIFNTFMSATAAGIAGAFPDKNFGAAVN